MKTASKLMIAMLLAASLTACGGGTDPATEPTAVKPETDICNDSTKQWTWAWQKHCTGEPAPVEPAASKPEQDICQDVTKQWTWAWRKHCVDGAQ